MINFFLLSTSFGTFPTYASYKMTPNDQQSAFLSYGWHVITSGAIYVHVPATVLAGLTDSRYRATPKSAIFATRSKILELDGPF